MEAEFKLQYFEVLMQMVRLTFLNVEIGQIFSFKAISWVGRVRVIYGLKDNIFNWMALRTKFELTWAK